MWAKIGEVVIMLADYIGKIMWEVGFGLQNWKLNYVSKVLVWNVYIQAQVIVYEVGT